MIKLTILLLSAAIASFVIGMIFGFERGTNSADKMEAAVVASFLKESAKSNETGELCRQFVLARFYYLLTQCDTETARALFIDYGPVDTVKLRPGAATKDPFDVDSAYRDLKARVGK
ncbi:MAG: hypothetical protein ACAI34_16085 [Verrucomicrobium sp.]